MKREDVDGSALTPDVERDLGRYLPLVRRQDLHDTIDQACVTGIEQSVQAFALPQEANIDPRAERSRDSDERVDRDSIRMPALDAPDDSSRNMRLSGEPSLCPATTLPKRSHPEPEPDHIHPRDGDQDRCTAAYVPRRPAGSQLRPSERFKYVDA
jgi:hypothetical protein